MLECVGFVDYWRYRFICVWYLSFFHPFHWFSTLMSTKFSEIGQNWPHLASFRAQNRHILKKSIAQASCGLMGIFIVFIGFGLLVVDSLTGVCAIFRHFTFLPIFYDFWSKKCQKTTIFGHFWPLLSSLSHYFPKTAETPSKIRFYNNDCPSCNLDMVCGCHWSSKMQ